MTTPQDDTQPVRNDITGEAAAAEIDAFDASVDRFRRGRVPDNVFLEHRLRHGVYGMRQDGVHMMRSKQPLGLITPDQLDAMADLTEAYTAGIAHLTTRQDIQIHFVQLEQTPDVMRVLARAQGTFREACGNVVRNVTAPPVSGVWPDEAFDVTPHGLALARFLLKHPDGQSLGRKFKIQLSGTTDRRWNQAAIHDVGATARLRAGERGFEIRVGGGLGAVPHPAEVLYDWVPEAELLPVTLAVLRLFAAHGEKQKRARARLKFLVQKLGIDAFRDLVDAERASLPDDPRWTEALTESLPDRPLHGPATAWPVPRDPTEATWFRTNVFRQRQDGYAAVKVRVPTGDLTPAQLRGIAALARTHTGDTVRIGVDQSLLIRFVPLDRLPAVRDALAPLGLASVRAGGLGDTVTCPGADTCKLGITTPRALAAELQPLLDALATEPRLEALRIHVSGCPNSCSQHQIADIGLFGAARSVGGLTAPHFVLLLGGESDGRGPGDKPGDGLGTAILKLPARRVPEAIGALLERFLRDAAPTERFGQWVRRTGRPALQALLKPYQQVGSPDSHPEHFVEFGREAGFAVRRGVGECAGEVVDAVDLLLADADRAAEDAQTALDADAAPAVVADAALEAFELAARALLALDGPHDPALEPTVDRFRRSFYDAGRIFEGVGHTYLAAAAESADRTPDRLRRLVAEAGLFVEEAHSIVGRTRNPWQGAAK